MVILLWLCILLLGWSFVVVFGLIVFLGGEVGFEFVLGFDFLRFVVFGLGVFVINLVLLIILIDFCFDDILWCEEIKLERCGGDIWC